MSRLMAILLPLGILTTVAPAWTAGVDNAVFALHIQSHATKSALICSSSPAAAGPPIACSGYRYTWPLRTGGDLYVVVAQADTGGIGGATFGIDFEGVETGVGVDVLGWTFCTTGLEFPSEGWPGAGSGNIITWLTPTDCAQEFIGADGIQGVLGSFYVYAYSDDLFRVRDHPRLSSDQTLAVSTCAGADHVFDADDYARLGRVGFGGRSDNGCNPCVLCEPLPVLASTWGGIKTRYRN